MSRIGSRAETARPRSHRRGARKTRLPWGWLAAGAALGLVALAYVVVTSSQTTGRSDPRREASADPRSTTDPRITLVAGERAPDFAMRSTAGQQVRLSDYRGKKNVLLFFQEGVMCPPCWQQMRDLRPEQAKLDALNVVFLTIAVDPPEMLARNAERERVADMTVLYDAHAEVSRAYQALYVSMHPGERPGHTFILVDADGVIRWRSDFREMWVATPRILEPVARALGK